MSRTLTGRNTPHSSTSSRIAFLFATAMVFALALPLSAQDRLAATQNGLEIPDSLIQKAQSSGWVRILIRVDAPFTPEGMLAGPDRVRDQRSAISQAQDRVLQALPAGSYELDARFQTVPWIAITASPTALAALDGSNLARAIQVNAPEPPALEDSIPLIGADGVWDKGVTGAGNVLAILDTGVDTGHSFFAGKIVSEACYSDNDDCPNGNDAQTGPGAGVPCTYSPTQCDHGTHVAGIAAGGAGVLPSGVAYGAGIIAIQVFSRFSGGDCPGGGPDPCALTLPSDQIKGLERVYDLRNTFNIVAANMSLGGGMNLGPCDGDSRKDIIDNLRSANIATVVASGNDGFPVALAAPACISSAISVGSTDTSTPQNVASSSNSASFLDLLAPGVSINSSVPGGGFANKSGTSMATPHVTGAWAIIRQFDPGASVGTVLNVLASTGVPVTDAKNGITKPRIDLAAACELYAPKITCADRQVCNSPSLCETTVECEVGVAFCCDPNGDELTQNCSPNAIFGVGATDADVTCSDGVSTVDEVCEVEVLDCEEPFCDPPSDLDIECNARFGVPESDPAIQAFLADATATDNCDGDLPVVDSAPALFPSGCAGGETTTVQFQSEDSADNESACAADVTVRDTTPPSVFPPSGIALECNEPGGIAGDDCDIQLWLAQAMATDICHDLSLVDDAPAFFPAGCGPMGEETPVTFTATDDCGHQTAQGSSVTVTDTTPPEVEASEAELYCLRPFNHKYFCFEHDDFQPVVQDVCSEPSTWVFDDCASNQPVNATGDGNTAPDCIVAPDQMSFCVRAERNAHDPSGRKYAVSILATDDCGNTSDPVTIGHVLVPHSGPTADCLRIGDDL